MTCPSLIEGTSFTFKNGRTFTVMQDISCKTKNLVYDVQLFPPDIVDFSNTI
jgi:hypothetical protein